MFLHGDPIVVSSEIARRYELAGVPVVPSGRLLPLLTMPALGITSSFRARREAHRHRVVIQHAAPQAWVRDARRSGRATVAR